MNKPHGLGGQTKQHLQNKNRYVQSDHFVVEETSSTKELRIYHSTHLWLWPKSATSTFYFFIIFFFIPFTILALLAHSLPVVTKIRGHIAGSSLLSPPHYGITTPSFLLFLSREELSIFFPHRLASNCAYPRC